MKGAISRVIRKEFSEIEEFLRGDSFWADDYFAETVRKVDEEIIRKYIDVQCKYPDYVKGLKPRPLAAV